MKKVEFRIFEPASWRNDRKLKQMYSELALDNMTSMEYRAKKKAG